MSPVVFSLKTVSRKKDKRPALISQQSEKVKPSGAFSLSAADVPAASWFLIINSHNITPV